MSNMEGEFRLGIKTKLFNYNLKEALDATGKTKPQIAQELGLSPHWLYDWVNFKTFPDEERRIQVAIYLNCPVDSLFPESIGGVRLEKQPEAIALTATEASAFGLLGNSDPVAALEDEERNLAVMDAIRKLKPRQQQVMSLRYGLTDGKERTLSEVGAIMGVTKERIRQLDQKSLRDLRHPSRSVALREFIE